MKWIKNPRMNVFFISFLSCIYAFIFIITASHMEFNRLFKNTHVLNGFWRDFAEFIKVGNMKYIGYITLLLVFIIMILSLFKKGVYDEYQTAILLKGLTIAGFVSIILTPILIISVVSVPQSAIPTAFLFVLIQWVPLVVCDVVFLIRNI